MNAFKFVKSFAGVSKHSLSLIAGRSELREKFVESKTLKGNQWKKVGQSSTI